MTYRRFINMPGLQDNLEVPNARLWYNFSQPSEVDMAHFARLGFAGIRLPVALERIVDMPGYIGWVLECCAWARRQGLLVLVDFHNGGKWRWKPIHTVLPDYLPALTIAAKALNGKAWGLEVMNEPEGFTKAQVGTVNQACVDAIRKVNGTAYIGCPTAHYSFTGDGLNTTLVKDPKKRVFYVGHLYPDTWSTGSFGDPVRAFATEGVSLDVLVERVEPFIRECKSAGVVGMVTECGAPVGQRDYDEVMLRFARRMRAAGMAWAYWPAGPWTGGDASTLQPVNAGRDTRLSVIAA